MNNQTTLTQHLTPTTSLSVQNCDFFYGVDMSKADFTAAQMIEHGKYEIEKIENTSTGIADFIATIKVPQKTLVTLEATGTYSMKLVFALVEANIPTVVLNPKQSKGFISGVLLSTSKTDDKDACALALYGQVNRPKLYTLPNDKVLELRQLRNLMAMYKKRKAATFNMLHALSYHPQPCEFVVQSLEEEIEILKKKISNVEQKLCDVTQSSFEQMYQLTLSIKGIGTTTATALLMVTGGCEGFKNAKQLAKFLGVCPTQKESGTSLKGRGSIAKTGTKELRTLLYMCARSAKRYNLACKDLYERLRKKGKCHKVAMTAVCHKLVKQFFAIMKSGKSFDNQVFLDQMKKQEKKTFS